MPAPPLHLVWFKRDLRVHDHAPLVEAARAAARASGVVLPLFIVEPGYWREPDVSARQYDFLRESLLELRAVLAELGQPLVVRVGEAVEVLEGLRQAHAVAALWSHEETGGLWTYARDRAVAAWARQHGIPWEERRQTGVVRRLGSRDGWARRWDRLMRAERLAPPWRPDGRPALGSGLAALDLDPGAIPAADALGLAADPCPGRQAGGRAAGRAVLRGFLTERGRPYRRAMASPGPGAVHCSRLSPHLAWGTLSLREVSHAVEGRLAALDRYPPEDREGWGRSLGALAGRLRWHCHFMQKLEDRPDLEQRCLHPAYEALRQGEGARGLDPDRLAAWTQGRTGWPFVDAAMRSLRATGWLNFRARAMLVAVASYQLWQDWRPSGLVLARLFTDYEPGIHWSQMQMQSGTTGINTVRMYNPVKQGLDQDPDGAFVRRWVPELAKVPLPFLHEPWTMPEAVQADAGCRLGRDYPAPLVDHVAAARAARERVWALRQDPAFKAVADAIQAKHGSRRSGLPRAIGTPARPAGGDRRQLSLRL